ncbi:MAG: MBL fold metallo-hydrolase, partial [Bryobacterales bacterium]|nr:MBL fold metallo-hydrolase [Bryobacterales bacterium]
RALALLAAAACAAAQTYPVTQGKTYKFEKIADGIYYATGGGGSNNVVVVNDADVLLVDDGTTPTAARAFIADVKTLTSKPIRYVVNTHFHYDHTDGNSVFPPDVDIIGHEFVRHAILDFDVLHREPFITSQARMPAAERDTIKPTPPNVTYSSKMILNKGPREIQLLFLGRGHTAGDTVVFLPRERIVATGDLMESRLAYMGDAYFDEWVTTLENLKKLDFATVLPGHGAPFSDKGLITAFQAYLSDLVKQGTALKKQGVSADDAAKRVDLTAHAKAFPQIQGPGADIRGMRRLYTWLDEK